ncbi:hypothetical protein KI387_027920, partial [Taxus chinensis]
SGTSGPKVRVGRRSSSLAASRSISEAVRRFLSQTVWDTREQKYATRTRTGRIGRSLETFVREVWDIRAKGTRGTRSEI